MQAPLLSAQIPHYQIRNSTCVSPVRPGCAALINMSCSLSGGNSQIWLLPVPSEVNRVALQDGSLPLRNRDPGWTLVPPSQRGASVVIVCSLSRV